MPLRHDESTLTKYFQIFRWEKRSKPPFYSTWYKCWRCSWGGQKQWWKVCCFRILEVFNWFIYRIRRNINKIHALCTFILIMAFEYFLFCVIGYLLFFQTSSTKAKWIIAWHKLHYYIYGGHWNQTFVPITMLIFWSTHTAVMHWNLIIFW